MDDEEIKQLTLERDNYRDLAGIAYVQYIREQGLLVKDVSSPAEVERMRAIWDAASTAAAEAEIRLIEAKKHAV